MTARRQVLVVWGGWEGHEPRQVAELLAGALQQEHFDVEVSDTLDAFRDEERLQRLSLIVPVHTMGAIEKEQLDSLLAAVRGGVGLAGCHGGMCDSFRTETEYQFMTGGQFVAHPGSDGVSYRVNISPGDHEITRGMKSFEVTTEQYYMHVDPAIRALATTRFPVAPGPHEPNGPVDMPIAWTKYYGLGRVFYCSLGHSAEVVSLPPVLDFMTRGMAWAARGGMK